MPVNWARYPSDWRQISLRIRERDGGCCKFCGIHNGTLKPSGTCVVLTVAHLGAPYPDGTLGNKHDKYDCRDENLASLCQACHLAYDRADHIRNAALTRRERKLQAGQLEMNV